VYLVLPAIKDAYITDKIISNKFRVTDANTGAAGTLDLFKLYDESNIEGVGEYTELSRLLIKFDYDELSAMIPTGLDLNDDSLECILSIKNIVGGQTNPSNFTISLFPLNQTFDEGLGTDVTAFTDIGSTNWVTASIDGSSPVLWNAPGAGASGALGTPGIDIISQADFLDGSGLQPISRTQTFDAGGEDLSIDITTILSATLAGQLPNHGFRLSFLESQELDQKTRFVKRFASRHVNTPSLKPTIKVSWDDSIHDNHENFYFGLTGSVFLNNYHRGQKANILSGSPLAGLTGPDCMKLDIVSGSFKKTVDVSQYKIGDYYVPGQYTASLMISPESAELINDEDSISDFIINSGSIVFDEFWRSNTGEVGFHTGSLKIMMPERTTFSNTKQRLELVTTNASAKYMSSDVVRFRVFVADHNLRRTSAKLPIELKSLILDEAYYRIRDELSGEVIIPFKTSNNGTRLSTDSDGMFFSVHMESLIPGRPYTIDYLVIERGNEQIFEDTGTKFKVEQDVKI
jgi:hypothetical protein